MKTNARGSGMKTFLAVIFSVMLTFTMMPVLPFMTGDVHATSYTFIVSDSNVTIADGTEANTVKVIFGAPQDTKDNISNADTITLTSNGTATNHTVSIETTNNVTLILDGLNINVSSNEDACAFSKTGTGELTVSLVGTNKLTSGINRAGLEKNGTSTESGSLIIEDFSGDNNVGSLDAYSGANENGRGAGIGGKANPSEAGYSGENITISSGSVTAKSLSGAGIGGGAGNTGGAGNNITISGGDVKATSWIGAGIGDGYGETTGGAGGNITISDGSVTASSYDGSGIGGGSGNTGTGGACGDVTISGGSITTTSTNGAGIGGAVGIEKGGAGGDVTISGGSVTATSANSASIGGGAGQTKGAGGTLSSTTTGNGWIVSNKTIASNVDQNGFTSGVLIDSETPILKGNVTVTENSGTVTVPQNTTLTIPSGQSLTIPKEVTLTNNGTLTNAGTFTSGSAISYVSGSAFTSTGNVTLPVGTNNVTFNPTGGTLNVKELAFDASSVTLTSPSKTGKVCGGWNDGTTAYGATEKVTPTAAMTLTAQWADPTYTAALTPDGNDFGSQAAGYSPVTAKTFTIENTGTGSLTTVAASLSGTNASSFTLDQTGMNTSLAAGATTTFKVKPNDNLAIGDYTADVTVTASNNISITKTVTFKVTAAPAPSANTYKVTLKGNGGTGSALTSYTEGTGAALPADWTKEGYTFAGWYDNEGLTGSAVASITKTDTGAKTFYAKWTKNGDGATSAPKTPVKVKAKAAGTHSIKITWSKAKGASYYKIYKVTKKSGTSAKSNSYKYIGKTTGTSFTAKSLKAGTTYSFKVKAVNSAGNSKLSKIVTAKTKKSSGAVNGSVGFTLKNISGNNVKVHWSKVSGAAKYQVASNSSGKMKTKWTGKNSLCTYTSTNLTKGKTYKYKMRYCKTSNGKNVWSKWSAVKTIKVK